MSAGIDNPNFKHGHAVGGLRSGEQQSYTMMLQRCLNPKRNDYRYYGGRGITVCQRWIDSFDNFLADMGPKPTRQHTLDRKDTNGNYEPSNCRWLTRKDQAINRRKKSCFRWPPTGPQTKYPDHAAIQA